VTSGGAPSHLHRFGIRKPDHGFGLRIRGEHAPEWARQILGKYFVLERDEWEARGAGYRGAHLGG